MNYERWVACLGFGPIILASALIVLSFGASLGAMAVGHNVLAMQIIEIGVSVSILSMLASVIIVQLLPR